VPFAHRDRNRACEVEKRSVPAVRIATPPLRDTRGRVLAIFSFGFSLCAPGAGWGVGGSRASMSATACKRYPPGAGRQGHGRAKGGHVISGWGRRWCGLNANPRHPRVSNPHRTRRPRSCTSEGADGAHCGWGVKKFRATGRGVGPTRRRVRCGIVRVLYVHSHRPLPRDTFPSLSSISIPIAARREPFSYERGRGGATRLLRGVRARRSCAVWPRCVHLRRRVKWGGRDVCVARCVRLLSGASDGQDGLMPGRLSYAHP
jgi:hypothetical protein